jgi:hypothetical protein
MLIVKISSVSDPDSLSPYLDSFRIHGFDDKKFDHKLLHEGRPSYRRSLQPSKENIRHFKTISWTFLYLGFIFALLDPDPLTCLNPNPDLKHWEIDKMFSFWTQELQ